MILIGLLCPLSVLKIIFMSVCVCLKINRFEFNKINENKCLLQSYIYLYTDKTKTF